MRNYSLTLECRYPLLPRRARGRGSDAKADLKDRVPGAQQTVSPAGGRGSDAKADLKDRVPGAQQIVSPAGGRGSDAKSDLKGQSGRIPGAQRIASLSEHLAGTWGPLQV
jgi:hypothetical protein